MRVTRWGGWSTAAGSLVAIVCGCEPAPCPDGYLRDNDGNCVLVGDDDDDTVAADDDESDECDCEIAGFWFTAGDGPSQFCRPPDGTGGMCILQITDIDIEYYFGLEPDHAHDSCVEGGQEVTNAYTCKYKLDDTPHPGSSLEPQMTIAECGTKDVTYVRGGWGLPDDYIYIWTYCEYTGASYSPKDISVIVTVLEPVDWECLCE